MNIFVLDRNPAECSAEDLLTEKVFEEFKLEEANG